MKKFISEFKTFAMRGNVIDLAVAVVIGAAFSKIVSSLVDNVITPFIGLMLGGVDFSELSFSVKDTVFNYGAFIQSIVDFVIIAFVIFIVIKTINKVQRKKEAKEEKEQEKVTEEVKLLTEIRNILAQK